METSIEIKIECKGHAVGTLGWFNSVMANSEFVIKNSQKGTPAMFLKTTDKEGKVKYSFLCEKYNPKKDPFGYKITSDDYACEIPTGDGYVSGLFDFPLTQACKKAVEEVIIKAKDIFAEWWENDGNSIE